MNQSMFVRFVILVIYMDMIGLLLIDLNVGDVMLVVSAMGIISRGIMAGLYVLRFVVMD